MSKKSAAWLEAKAARKERRANDPEVQKRREDYKKRPAEPVSE